MDKWEFKGVIISFVEQDKINVFGREGWELVSVLDCGDATNNEFWFKRKIDENKNNKAKIERYNKLFNAASCYFNEVGDPGYLAKVFKSIAEAEDQENKSNER